MGQFVFGLSLVTLKKQWDVEEGKERKERKSHTESVVKEGGSP